MHRSSAAESIAALPDMFCWTKYGTEAGEAIDSILARKEAERAAGNGVFLWGIGNAIGPSVAALVAHAEQPQVVFTPMKSRPAKRDVSPALVAEWHAGIGLDGQPYEVPDYARVTSRTGGSRSHHYALVCRSQEPLEAWAGARSSFAAAHVENLRSGCRVGASQVTSVVRRVACAIGVPTASYPVAFSADLVAPYFVRLTDRSIVTDRPD